MTRGIGLLLMMHVPYHHPRGHKLPVYDHKLPVRSVRFPAYSVRSHPVRRHPLCIVLHLRDTQLLQRRSHQGIKMLARVTIAIARTPLGTRIKVRVKPNRERVDLVVLCSKRQGVRSSEMTMVDNGLGPGSNIAPSASGPSKMEPSLSGSGNSPTSRPPIHEYSH